MKNYYIILGVEEAADSEAIKSAYRKLSKKFHPDLNAGDPFFLKRFQDLQEAYDVLSVEKKRQDYDRQLAILSGRKSSSTCSNCSDNTFEQKLEEYRRLNKVFREQQASYNATSEDPKNEEAARSVHKDSRPQASAKLFWSAMGISLVASGFLIVFNLFKSSDAPTVLSFFSESIGSGLLLGLIAIAVTYIFISKSK